MERTIPLILKDVAQRHPDLTALFSKDAGGSFVATSYRQHYEEVLTFASGLADLGVKRNDHLGLMADNRREWALADRATLCLGASDVPRGCDATEKEIGFILAFSDCRICFVENRRMLDKVLSERSNTPALELLVMFDEPEDQDRAAAKKAKIDLMSMEEVMQRGRTFRSEKPHYVEVEMDNGVPSEVATIIFTSGTTGEPKGVMLTHANYVFQLESIPLYFMGAFKPGQRWLSVLPIWHSFARVLEYIAMSQAHAIAYSKPVAAVMLPDFAAINPQWFGSVPRIWEAVMDGVYRNIKAQGAGKEKLFGLFVSIGKAYSYFRFLFLGLIPDFGFRPRLLEMLAAIIPLILLWPLNALGNLLVFRKVKAKLGTGFMAGVSGGGALPPRVDKFFRAIGVRLLEGYGLTESAPVICVRKFRHPVSGTVGPFLKGCEVKITGEDGQSLKYGKAGIIRLRGPQIMLGYLKRPELGAKILDKDGWLDTGDIGKMTRFGEVKITGRAKDTIVLLGGENIEPAPIEAKLCESPYILQACVVGQDQKYLGALIVPREDAVTAFAKDNGIMVVDWENLCTQPEIIELIEDEITTLVGPKTGFKLFERVVRFSLVVVPFSAGKELSHKLDLARHQVVKIHAKRIAALF